MAETDDFEKAGADYERAQPMYKCLAAEIACILKTKLEEAKLKPVSITHRPKDIERFVEKAARKNYTDPLSQMTDLAGVRVVCAYESELPAVAVIVESNFDVRERIDKARDLGPDKMGYKGRSFVVTLGTRYAGGRYENITDLTCEIQVRTILQDAWAIVSHHLVYPNEESMPQRLRRDLNIVSSLLEIAEGIFDSVKEKREIYVREIQEKERDRPAFLAQPLDFDTVIAYTHWKFPDRNASEKLTQILLRDINFRNYPTLQQLDAVVERARVAVETYRKENPDWFKTGTDFLTKSLGFVDSEFRAKHGFAGKTRAAFDKYQSLVTEQS